jgi:hypothetical protein
MDAERQRFDTLVMHTPHGTARYRLPWTFSTFDYRNLCQLLWRDCDASFETAKVNGRVAPANGDGRIAVDTDRGTITAPLVVDALGWRRMLANGDGYQPPDAPLSRGLEVHPHGTGDDLELWIDRRYVPAGYGWSFPAGDELRIGVGSFDPRFHVRQTTELLAEDLGQDRVRYQGNWIPHKIRTALYFGIGLGRELRSVIEGRKSRPEAESAYASFHDSHEWKFGWLLRVQKLVPQVPPRLLWPLIRLLGTKRFVDWSFKHYLAIAPPEFAGLAGAPRSADDEDGPGQQQDDAEDALRRERRLLQAEQA